MFEPGSLIVYGNSGICRVEGVSMKQQLSGGGQAMYYTLTPLFGSGTVYTPVDTKVFMRPVITGEEAKTSAPCRSITGAFCTPTSANRW